jgi:hypothetical protein
MGHRPQRWAEETLVRRTPLWLSRFRASVHDYQRSPKIRTVYTIRDGEVSQFDAYPIGKARMDDA